MLVINSSILTIKKELIYKTQFYFMIVHSTHEKIHQVQISKSTYKNICFIFDMLTFFIYFSILQQDIELSYIRVYLFEIC